MTDAGPPLNPLRNSFFANILYGYFICVVFEFLMKIQGLVKMFRKVKNIVDMLFCRLVIIRHRTHHVCANTHGIYHLFAEASVLGASALIKAFEIAISCNSLLPNTGALFIRLSIVASIYCD